MSVIGNAHEQTRSLSLLELEIGWAATAADFRTWAWTPAPQAAWWDGLGLAPANHEQGALP